MSGSLGSSTISRIADKVFRDCNTDCWHWAGAIQPTGYGTIWNGTRPEQAHRVAYRALVGDIPEGQEIDHLCRVRGCVNPDHLRLVTHRENIRCSSTVMAKNAAKTHCMRGHPLSGSNLRIAFSGSRQCRECLREYARQRRQRLRNG